MRRKVKWLFFFLAFFFLIPTPLFATSNFYYDFENGSFEGWTVINKKRDYLWSVVQGDNGNHYFGSKVNDNFSYTEVQAGDFLWDDYEFEFDLIRKSGQDINFFFRVRDERSAYDDGNGHVFNWPQGYGIHVSFNTVYLAKFFSDHYIPLTPGKNLSPPSNGVYHFKIVAYKNIFKIYENNNLLIDFVDTNVNDAFLRGRIALGVGTGAVAPTEVYFDNIKVTKIKDPVVIVPGHGASINFGEMFLKIRYPDIYTPAHLEESPFPWHMMPGVKIYNPLITALENAGYEEGRDLFVFNYNWLEKIRSEDGNKGSAEKLADFLNEKLEEGQKADVIAHSMGGLVARTCLQQVSGCPIDQLITVGTPHKGVVDTYGAWEGGEVWRPGLSKFAFSLVLHLARQEGESLYQTVQRLAPSTEEMLPTFSYLYAGDENEPLSYSFASPAYPQNTLLNQLSPPENLGESLKLIYGEGKDTLSGVKIKERSWYDQILGKWSHGKPIEKKYSFGGDGTVLVQSARPFENSSGNVAGFNFDHGEIISKNEALGKIFSFLNLPPPAVNGDVLFERNATDYLAFYLLSPAYLDINLMGILSENIFIGQEEQDKPKLIIIANPPSNWQKEVVVKGVDDGEYVLGVGLARGEETSWREYHGEIKLGEEDKFLIEATDKISLKSKESSGEKRQDQEMLSQLKTGFSSSSLLTEKLEHLTALMKISPVEALKYAYRIKNLVALEAKEKGTSPDDLNQMNKKLDQLIVYLEAAAENEEEIYSEGKAALAYQETKALLEELEQLSPSPNNPFVISAAQRLTLAEESLPSSLPRDLGELIRLGRGYFLGINSKILLN
ncbi:MAG: lipase/acyltransferase domain-containing protein [Patescibacteria group bacterium]|jgi:pimeloyl-ACP methyl ester carboxylesterase